MGDSFLPDRPLISLSCHPIEWSPLLQILQHSFFYSPQRSWGFSLRITATRDNSAPEITPIGLQAVREGNQLTFTIQATDPDQDPLTYSSPGLNLANAFFNESTRQFFFAPAAGQAGNYQVLFTVSDGRTTSQMIVPIQVQPSGQTQVLDLVVDPVPSPTFQSAVTISGSVTGQAGPPSPPQLPTLITGLSPASIRQGESKVIEITGLNTNFAQGTCRGDFGDGITVESLTILSPTRARASILVDRLAQIGTRVVRILEAGREIPSVVGFSVEHGAASISGIVIDPFTQQPLANALVGVNGSLVSTLTDGTGHFTLNNVPSGNVSVMVTLPNYGVGKISLAISPNDSITLTDPIQLNALARPPNFGGVLPRAATVASVIDRGVSSKGGGLTLEQAKAVINDTIIAVGGIEFGVMVEAGNQLNPKMEGPGELSLTHEGVGRQPEAMILGDVYTVKDLFFMLKALFSFPLGLTMGEVISGFQRSVDEAWANPGEPGSAMAIVLFNEGNTLSSSPPIITADTRFNRFQLFLLTSSFLVYHRASLEQSTEDVLKAHGVDYESMLPPQKVSKASDASQTRMVPSASDPKPSPAVGDLTAKQTFAKVWRTLGANMIVQAQHAAFEGAKIAMLAQIFIGLTIGITGGRLGMAAAVLDVAAAAVMGATATLVFMTVIGWYIGVVAASFEPEPSGNVESYLDQNGNFVIRFSRSESENNAASQPVDSKLKRDYAYHLYRFQNSSDTVWATGEYMPLEAVDDMKDPNNKKKLPTGRKKFVVPRCLLRAGANHFRIVTFQYYHNS